MANPKAIGKGCYQVEGGLYDIYGEFPVGATGAVGTVVRNRELGTIARLGVGNYRIPLREGWNALMDHSINVIDATPGAADGTHAIISVRTLGTGAPLIEFFTYRVDTGAAADPRSGAVVSFRFRLQNGQRV